MKDSCSYDISVINDVVNNKFIMLIRGFLDNKLEGHPLNKMIILQTDLLGQCFQATKPESVTVREMSSPNKQELITRNKSNNSEFTKREMQNLTI